MAPSSVVAFPEAAAASMTSKIFLISVATIFLARSLWPVSSPEEEYDRCKKESKQIKTKNVQLLQCLPRHNYSQRSVEQLLAHPSPTTHGDEITTKCFPQSKCNYRLRAEDTVDCVQRESGDFLALLDDFCGGRIQRLGLEKKNLFVAELTWKGHFRADFDWMARWMQNPSKVIHVVWLLY